MYVWFSCVQEVLVQVHFPSPFVMLMILARISYMTRGGGLYFALNNLEQSLIHIHQALRILTKNFSVLLHEPPTWPEHR